MKVLMEQWSQARRIHGGLFPALLLAGGVRAARMPIPSRALRRRIFRSLYGNKYPPIPECELEKPLEDFRSVNELFTRGVQRKLPPRNKADRRGLVSPCDCCVQEVGKIDADRRIVVKEIGYRIDTLVPERDLSGWTGGNFATLFLSPADCHRIFSPVEGKLTSVTHVPGARLLVHPPYQREEFPVFTLNERLVLELQTDFGPCLLVMVAGWGVGNMTHPFPLDVARSRNRISHLKLPEPRPVEQCEWIATFELGSTVILLVPPSAEVSCKVEAEQKLVFGSSLFPRRDS